MVGATLMGEKEKKKVTMTRTRNPRLLKQRYSARLHGATQHRYVVLIDQGTVDRLQRIYEQWGLDAFQTGQKAVVGWRVQDMAAWAVNTYASDYDPLEEGLPWDNRGTHYGNTTEQKGQHR
jgi:hypothetical protein